MKIEKADLSMEFSEDLYNDMEDLSSSTVTPCSVNFNDSEIGGLFINCPLRDIKYFGIKINKPLTPFLKFRMIDVRKQYYLIEVLMIFDEGKNKTLKLHLNPHDLNVQKFLKLITLKQAISFHLNIKETNRIISGIKTLDGEELNWFVKNYVLSSTLEPNTRNYLIVEDYLKKEKAISERIYRFLPSTDSNYFF
ncbi:MAG: hypothetical protein RO257_02930 [Candidatus Kapabacteria bacterium]|nr:hypothetical protein [Candidatus Kapabacteria bacterium]